MIFNHAYQGIHIAFIDVRRVPQLGSSPFDVKLILLSSWRVVLPGSVMLLLMLLFVCFFFSELAVKPLEYHNLLLYADLSHLPKKNDNGRIHKENMQPHTLISTTPRAVPLATQNHSKKMRLKRPNDKVTFAEQRAHSFYQEMTEAPNHQITLQY